MSAHSNESLARSNQRERDYLNGPPGTREMAELVERRMEAMGLDVRSLAKAVGKSTTYVRHILKGHKPITKESTIDAFARALGVHQYDIYAAQHMVPHEIVRKLESMNRYELVAAWNAIAFIDIDEDEADAEMEEEGGW